MFRSHLIPRSVAPLAILFFVVPVSAAKLTITQPLGRSAYQTNEWIDLSVVRSEKGALKKGDLELTVSGADGSKFDFTFAVPGVEAAGEARRTEHLHLNGWLLRPGKYAIEASCDGDKANTEIEVFSHLRKSSFKLINWGRANNKQKQLPQGEDSLGYNVFYGGYGNDDNANFLRAGVDFIANCVMSGGHQMDLRMECDWSDPYVTRAGTMRVVKRAMFDRTRPNVPGVHFYDEPGLTWHQHPQTKEFTPHGIPAQVRSYEAAFGKKPPDYNKVDPKDPESVRAWKQWATWKLGMMDAAWKESQFGVSWVRPDFLSLTQSQYGWTAFTDGYYFNVVRSLPITSGHGGYHDIGPGYYCPSYFVEMSRARDLWKPCWYLPTWYGNTTSDEFRLEQFLSFQTNIQGMMSPPDLEPADNATGRQGIVETNHLFQKLGPIFTTMPATKPPVAVLYSLSQAIHTQTKDRNENYVHSMPHGTNLPLVYVAGKLIQHQFLGVVEEDILDGTVANDHRAIILTSLDYLDPKVIRALESFVKEGGVVLMTGDCKVAIKGAVKLAVTPAMPDQEKINEIMKTKKYDQLGPYTTTAKHIEGATPLAKAFKTALAQAKIHPVFDSDIPGIAATKQGTGDIEYIFAVNASSDETKPKERLAIKAVEATITVDAPEHGLYDAIRGGKPEEFLPAPGKKGLIGKFGFGPGQMRVWARTARPIGGIQVAAPVITRELVLTQEPIKLDISAVLLDNKNRLLCSSAPLHIRLFDPLGVTRHELYRATKLGKLELTLPLAANDPSGTWKVSVTELLSGKTDTVAFTYQGVKHARAIAGATQRAVYFGNDRENFFRFGRLNHQVTIVKGKSAFNDEAARRLVKVLKPWGIECVEMKLEDAAKSKTLSKEEAETWCGLTHAGKGQIKPGDGNLPIYAGFAVQGPVILLGNDADNPIIKFLLEQRFLPYTPDAAFPGHHRGYMAWQRDGVGRGQDSVTLIAHDEAGINEAVGSFYEAVAGLDPLTRWELPESDTLSPATKAPELHPVANLSWSVTLPDRVVALKVNGPVIEALAHDGSLRSMSGAGAIDLSKIKRTANMQEELKRLAPAADAQAAAAAKKQERADRMLKLYSASEGKLAVTYWGGTLRIVDGTGAILTEQQLPQDVTALTWAPGNVIAGLADGRVIALALPK
jgi:hypothetical protein